MLVSDHEGHKADNFFMFKNFMRSRKVFQKGHEKEKVLVRPCAVDFMHVHWPSQLAKGTERIMVKPFAARVNHFYDKEEMCQKRNGLSCAEVEDTGMLPFFKLGASFAIDPDDLSED